ncbi:MAG TPA: ABC transporter permease [Gammaproteobacteria bacterium]
MNVFWTDFRYALRTLSKRPGFTVAVVLTLAIGIGANSAMFSIINGVLLQPLPYPDAERLVVVNNSYPGIGLEQAATSIPDYLDRREGVQAFEDSALWQEVSAGVTTGSTPVHYEGVLATRTLFSTLQADPALGRNFTLDETQPGNDKVVILSHGMWQQMFAGRAAAIGADLRIDGVLHRVVGVMPEGFAFPDEDAAFYLPLAFTAEQKSDEERGEESYNMLARLAPGATMQQAHAQMQALFENLSERIPEYKSFIERAGMTTNIKSLHENYIDGAGTALLLLQLCVGFVLLIVCANIANLLLTRVVARQRELSVRTAMGAGRLRIARQLLTESVLLALMGGVGGILLAYAALAAFRASGMGGFASVFEIGLDVGVLMVTLLIALLTGFLFGLVPVAAAWRSHPVEVLKEGGRGNSSGKRSGFFRGALVVTQVTLAVALLVSAGLLIRSFAATQSVDPGFDETGVLTARISLPESRYPDATAIHDFQKRLEQKIAGLPGVEASALAHVVPFGNEIAGGGYAIRGREQDSGAPVRGSKRNAVSEGYFEAMQIDLLQGRGFESRDMTDKQYVVIIDETLAKRFFADESPLGHEITFNPGNGNPLYRTIIGVAGNVKDASLDEGQEKEAIYLPLYESIQPEYYVVLRTAGNPDALAASLRNAIRSLDPEIPAYDIRTLHARIDESLQGRRTPMTLLAVFACIALVLAGIGLYGVLAFNVTQRTGEIGVRMALGASRNRVLKLVLGQGGRLILAGLGLGLVLAAALAVSLRSLLFGVSVGDPVVYLASVLLLAAVALLACLLPALRATRVEPIAALRYE